MLLDRWSLTPQETLTIADQRKILYLTTLGLTERQAIAVVLHCRDASGLDVDTIIGLIRHDHLKPAFLDMCTSWLNALETGE